MKTLAFAALAAALLAACAPRAPEKTVAAIDPKTSAMAPATPARMTRSQTQEEMLTRVRERFAAADLNQDGKVTTEELEQARVDRNLSGPRWGAGGRLMRADTDIDGEITLADVERHARDRFTRLDADKNGVVTGVETLHGASMKSPDLRGGAALVKSDNDWACSFGHGASLSVTIA